MKNLRVLFLLINFFFFQCAKEESPNPYAYTASLSKSEIKIDGILDEVAWSQSERVALKLNKTNEEVSDSSYMTYIRTCYDDQNLYIAYECNDSDIWSDFTNRDDHLWEKDAVEIFIDTDGYLNSYFEIQVSPNNVLFDAHLEIPSKTGNDEIIGFNVEGLKSAVSIDGTLNMQEDTDKKWTVEIAIPLAGLTAESANFDSGNWSINYFRMNHDIDGEKPELGWSPTLGDFHTPSKFGQLNFEK